ncbi:uncharacterized protein EAE97_000307 [Botrytis byssoidea]|uniref:Ilp is an apoptosis inhibitor n=1 Tax=Botrytis byssoidea TaxID=139641 RepID=A0A9P5M478_9HELO|nr:uncharacterized protein EAE97_000307 [Botrytis byssoidea]KAF7955048.1 hypothetical protein EAE97_000307 [Botrytis byssoidea]
MAYHSQAGPSNPNLHAQQQYQQGAASYGNPSGGNGNGGQEPEAGFDTVNWYRHYLQCHHYFLDQAQHDFYVQAVAAFINVQLPYQKQPYPVHRASAAWSLKNLSDRQQEEEPHPPPGYPQSVSLIPYIRRLIVTGHDDPRIMGTWFGANWVQGIGTIHELERRNYLFASKSKEWLDVKKYYDDSLAAEQSTPYMIPLPRIEEAELSSADEAWSGWMAMQDWVIGPRTPQSLKRPLSPPRSHTPYYNSPRIKKESDLDN